MQFIKELQKIKTYVGRLNFNDDLLEEFSKLAQKYKIKAGQIKAIGALQEAALGFYNQKEVKYETIRLNKDLEIISLIGNISLKDGQSFVHAHLCVSDKSGNCFGGHLMENCKVFACEYIIEIYEGELIRKLDKDTSLMLW